MTAHIDLTWLTGSGAGSAWDDLPLTDLISKAATLHSNADAIRTGPDAEQRQGAAIVLCRTLASRVERAGLFSANEEGDDLATADLKYLLAPYYLAELTGSSAPAGGPSARLQAVQEAVQNYSVFLQQCRQYELLGSVASSQYSQEENNGGQTDATTRRNAKIERFKAGKQIKSQIAMLERQKEHSKGDDEGDGTGPLGGVRGWDEEDERQLWQTLIQQAALQSLGQRELLRDEIKLLEHAVKAQASSQGKDERAKAQEERDSQERAQVLDQLKKIALSLDTSTTKRQQLANQVFQPGHLMPTMTLDELAEIEIADARRREEAEQAAQEAERQRKEALGDEEDEQELMRQRAWDDWKDSNPVGWGNSKTKPCH